jgi:hypothetical protein
MRSLVTSYIGMFEHRISGVPTIHQVEIPLIQRDYAQGRDGAAVQRIRKSFLSALHQAITSDEPLSLDFVYGDVRDGILRPLDGQQRLTTLFLLHWYLAYRADRMKEMHRCGNFTYATRPSARYFCEELVRSRPPNPVADLSEWIKDQPWYLYTWRHDPTIQSMLVMLAEIQDFFGLDDCVAAWERLDDPHRPAVTYHLLPIGETGLNEDLYIKMNSRGRPLTDFERFKAQFEQVLEASSPSRVLEFSLKVDGAWADLLWLQRSQETTVDDQFLKHFRFVTDICEWRQGRQADWDSDPLAEFAYGAENPNASANLEFLVQSLDTWVGVQPRLAFESLLFAPSAPPDCDRPGSVALFEQPRGLGVDLFAACCRDYGNMRGQSRVFSLQHTLLLYAVVLHRLLDTPHFGRRLRMLRNLVESSGNELRLENMPALITDVDRIVVHGSLEGVVALNQVQVNEERAKEALLADHPHLKAIVSQLEDHPMLRGSLAAFNLDAATLEQRGSAFLTTFGNPALWPTLTGALLAAGDYSRQLNNRFFQLGSAASEAPWRDVLTRSGRSSIARTRDILGRLLDELAQTNGNELDIFAEVQVRWLMGCEARAELDWRYYFVKYPIMRQGRSGRYVGWRGSLGYLVCMLDKLQMNSNYRDPYLSAIHLESGVGQAVENPKFYGYETQPRWLTLVKGGTRLRCVDDGILLELPPMMP